MRVLLALCLALVSAATAGASSPDCSSVPDHSRMASWRPQAWRPPGRTPSAGLGLRIEPEGGATLPTSADLEAQAAARRAALAAVPVHTRADGSRYAVLGGLVRVYMLAHIRADGSLVEECVHSEEQARRRVAQAEARGQ